MQPLRALIAQLLGLAATAALAWLLPGMLQGAGRFALAQGLLAAGCSRLLRQPAWWLPIHLLFLPAVLATQRLALPSEVYLAAFVLLALVFWGTVKGDVPLFLSSRAVVEAVARIVAAERAARFADLGAGVATVAAPLARRFPALRIEAWERAPLPWAVAAWRCRKLPNVRLLRHNFWNGDLSGYDVVFAFLSPAPMARLGEKLRREMRAGSLFVSSSFPVPGWQPESVRELGDRRGTVLYCYRMKGYKP